MPLYLKLYQEAIATGYCAIWPCILILLIVGLITSILQAVLQIEDATFALLPKTITMIIIASTGGFGMLYVFEELARHFIINAPALVHQTWY